MVQNNLVDVKEMTTQMELYKYLREHRKGDKIMAITSAVCSSFKQELLQGKHDFDSSGGHTFKIALFDSDASLGASTTDYSTSEEITNTSGSAYSRWCNF